MAEETDKERSKQLIVDQMKSQRLTKDLQVTQLFLAESGLCDVCDLGQFRDLQEVWANGNKLRRISFLTINYRISHLFLQDNELVDICGALSHLTNLQVLMLQSNQLTKLEPTIKEFKVMQALHTLNLSNNPLAQESEYRHYTIHYIPSLKLLDRSEILKSERDTAGRLYQQDRQAVKDTIAFGRRCTDDSVREEERSPSPPPPMSGRNVEPSNRPVADNFASSPRESPEEAVAERALKRSVMQYSHFDWSKVPKAEEKRLNKDAVPSNKSQIVTVRFR
ncbi:leucine-rich repeat-containing protein 72-like [Amphiura filiformis]|uniref:leucine-rich repeat-containing protein 72-like n=1 Tax=Amphiura filiformis TaxID=82378 RepID=UPI003B226DCE